jgi:hypothetical protein
VATKTVISPVTDQPEEVAQMPAPMSGALVCDEYRVDDDKACECGGDEDDEKAVEILKQDGE